MTVGELRQYLSNLAINDEDEVVFVCSNDDNPWSDSCTTDKVLHITSSDDNENGLICFMPD